MPKPDRGGAWPDWPPWIRHEVGGWRYIDVGPMVDNGGGPMGFPMEGRRSAAVNLRNLD